MHKSREALDEQQAAEEQIALQKSKLQELREYLDRHERGVMNIRGELRPSRLHCLSDKLKQLINSALAEEKKSEAVGFAWHREDYRGGIGFRNQLEKEYAKYKSQTENKES